MRDMVKVNLLLPINSALIPEESSQSCRLTGLVKEKANILHPNVSKAPVSLRGIELGTLVHRQFPRN